MMKKTPASVSTSLRRDKFAGVFLLFFTLFYRMRVQE